MTLAHQVDVFYGHLTPNSAQIYVRVLGIDPGEGWTMAGHIRGPFVPGTHTLPTEVPLHDLGHEPTWLAGCSLPEPCFWTTQLSGTYTVTVQLKQHGTVVETVIRSLGLRFFGVVGSHLRWANKRWVLRGVTVDHPQADTLGQWREQHAVMVTSDPSEELLAEASAQGVLLVIELDGSDVIHQVRRLSRWPAVAIVSLPIEWTAAEDLSAVAPNLLFAARMPADQPLLTVPPWAKLIVCDADQRESLARFVAAGPLPIVAVRRLNGTQSLPEARGACDRLQSDLVDIGDFAGYVV